MEKVLQVVQSGTTKKKRYSLPLLIYLKMSKVVQVVLFKKTVFRANIGKAED